MLIIALFSVVTSQSTMARQSPFPIVDLTESGLNEAPISLDQEWAFYWNQLIDPSESPFPLPDTLLPFTANWENIPTYGAFGYASYGLTVVIPPFKEILALELSDAYSSYQLFVNGVEIAKNGVVATSKSEYVPHWLPQTVSLPDFNTDTLTLVLHISNFDHSKGGAYLPFKLGSAKKLYRERYISYGYSFILTGISLMSGLFFLGLYLFGRREKSILYFALFCIVYSYRTIDFGSTPLHMLLPDIPWIITIRIDYLSLFLAGYLFGLYTLHLYPRDTSKPLIYVLSAISIVFAVESLFLPPSIFTQLAVPYNILLMFYLFVAFWIYTLAVLKKRPGAIYSLISSAPILIVFGYEIMVYLGDFETLLILNFFGHLFFFFLQSLVHSYRFSSKMQNALHQAQESSKAKSQFLSTMSHEIRTPLNAVIGLSGLLADSNLSPRQQEFSNTIKKSGESLLSLINNILDFSKIESGKLDLEENEFNLRETVETVLDVVSGVEKKPELEILYSIDDTIPVYVIGDSNRLQQVLTNLIANAYKFTQKGEILVNVSIEREFTESFILRFDVKDTGIGIPEDKLHRLFQSFSQVDASSTRRYGGTGLGLVISKRLVEAMGGEISVQSEENQGSTFTFLINVRRSARTIDFAIPSVLEHKKVFLLDDNETNLSIIQEQLVRANLKVSTFNNPNMLLASMAELKDFDFGILDMQMPDKDGVEVAQEIREQYSNNDLPLVLFSSVHDIEDREDKNLFDLFLKKPIQQTKFLNNLERLYLDTTTLPNNITNTGAPGKLFASDFKILIAEDNPVNQKVALRILERFGIHADIVENGEMALKAELKSEYDLIFMDMEMPVMDGLEATIRIKKKRRHGHKPIIVAMTANAMQEDRERCFEAGMDDFISKPITLQSTKKILIKWLADS